MVAKKYSQEVVDHVIHLRNNEERSVAWISQTLNIPIDTVRDWLYRGRRASDRKASSVSA
jgi:DNA-directed RNA polymerase specialized sigma24 family protein